jgi:hypothetical protein
MSVPGSSGDRRLAPRTDDAARPLRAVIATVGALAG